jgi:hypothetical protein
MTGVNHLKKARQRMETAKSTPSAASFGTLKASY